MNKWHEITLRAPQITVPTVPVSGRGIIRPFSKLNTQPEKCDQWSKTKRNCGFMSAPNISAQGHRDLVSKQVQSTWSFSLWTGSFSSVASILLQPCAQLSYVYIRVMFTSAAQLGSVKRLWKWGVDRWIYSATITWSHYVICLKVWLELSTLHVLHLVPLLQGTIIVCIMIHWSLTGMMSKSKSELDKAGLYQITLREEWRKQSS